MRMIVFSVDLNDGNNHHTSDKLNFGYFDAEKNFLEKQH